MRRWILSLAVMATTAGSAFAHDTWMVSDTPALRAGQPLVVRMTSGANFPQSGSAPDPARVARAGWRMGNQRGEIASFDKEDASIVAHGRPMNDGVGVAWADFLPRSVELEAKEVEGYFDEVGAPQAVRQEWEKAGAKAVFHETYTKHAKTFVRVGDAVFDRTCLEPVGLTIEFLPDRDPTMLAPGDTLAVKAVKGGNEMESFAVGVVCGADGSAKLLRTNKAGYISFVVEQGGWWMVRGTELRRNADGTWESDFSTMTFFAGGKR